MADIDRIRRNLGRMIDQGAPEADIDAYVASEGVTIDQVRASGDNGMLSTANRLVKQYGRAMVPGYDRAAAMVSAAKDSLTGNDGGNSFWENYESGLKNRFEDRKELDRTAGMGDILAKTAGYGTQALMTLPLAAFQSTAGPGASVGQMAAEGARIGAPIGMTQSYLDSPNEGAQRALDTAAGFVGGGVAGAAVPAVIAAAGVAKNAAGRGLNAMLGNGPRQRALNAEIAQQFDIAGVPRGPWVRANGDPGSVSMAESIGGGELRRDAAHAIDIAQGNLQGTLRRAGAAASAHDAGERAQNFTRRQLFERNIPAENIPNMPSVETQRLADHPPFFPGPATLPEPRNPNYTYKDEFALGYEHIRRDIPKGLRAPLVETGQSNKTGLPNELYAVIDDLRGDLRNRGLLRGDDRAKSIFDSPAAPAIEQALRDRLPKDIVDTLYSRTPIDTEARRQIRTALRELGDVPPAQRSLSDAYIQRMQRAVSDDMYGTIERQAVPHLDRAADRMRRIDEAYASHRENLVAPLRPITGENTTPEQAFQRLIRATQGDNQNLLHAYYAVNAAKGSRTQATASLIAEMSRDGMNGFVRNFGAITPEARRLMFGGNAAELGRDLTRFYGIARQLQPYQDAAATHGLNVTRAPNMIAAASLLWGLPGLLTSLGGQAAISHFMASPAYVRWLTRVPQAMSTPAAWRMHVNRLTAIAPGDTELGYAVGRMAEKILGMGPDPQVQDPQRPTSSHQGWSPRDVPYGFNPPPRSVPENNDLPPPPAQNKRRIGI